MQNAELPFNSQVEADKLRLLQADPSAPKIRNTQ